MKRLRRRLFTPLVQVLAALGLAYFGAWVIDCGRIALGITVLLSGVLLVGDGLFRNPSVPNDARGLTTHEEVLERYKRMR